MKTGAVIVAAGLSSRMKAFKPMLELGGSTIIKEAIASLKKAGVQDIAVVVGHKKAELTKHLASEKVFIVENPDYAESEMFHSVCLGLDFMKGYDVILFSPADIPMFAPQTPQLLCEEILKTGCAVVSPVYEGRKGHPVALNGEIIPAILKYDGNQGLKGALEHFADEHRFVEVNDLGILLDADEPEDYEHLCSYAATVANLGAVSLGATAELVREVPFWNYELTLILEAVEATGSLNKSCQKLGISYSKGWNAIKQAEYRLGFPLLDTNTGGVKGGGSSVTTEAKVLAEAFTALHTELNEVAQTLFYKHFEDFFKQSELE